MKARYSADVSPFVIVQLKSCGLRKVGHEHGSVPFAAQNKCRHDLTWCPSIVLRRTNAKSDTPGRIATAMDFESSFSGLDCSVGHGFPERSGPAERSLAHDSKQSWGAAYHRTDLLEQRRALLIEWSTFCPSADPESSSRINSQFQASRKKQSSTTCLSSCRIRSGS